jgi:hypothetical protein
LRGIDQPDTSVGNIRIYTRCGFIDVVAEVIVEPDFYACFSLYGYYVTSSQQQQQQQQQQQLQQQQ